MSNCYSNNQKLVTWILTNSIILFVLDIIYFFSFPSWKIKGICLTLVLSIVRFISSLVCLVTGAIMIKNRYKKETSSKLLFLYVKRFYH